MIYKSQNGWPAAEDRRLINVQTYRIAVKNGIVQVPLRKEVSSLLIQMIAWWDQNIEPVYVGDEKGAGTWGYAFRPVRGSTTVLSNHASGTAIDINAPLHPLKVPNTVTREQAARIRAKAASLGLKWGGDFSRVDEMHFEIAFPPPPEVVEWTNRAAAAAGTNGAPVASSAPTTSGPPKGGSGSVGGSGSGTGGALLLLLGVAVAAGIAAYRS